MNCIVLFQKDLRLYDHSALAEAIRLGHHIIPLYLHPTTGEHPWRDGAALDSWLHRALIDLAEQLEAKGGQLIVRSSEDFPTTLLALAKEFDAQAIFWSRRYEPHWIDTFTEAKSRLTRAGITARSFCASLLNEPHTIQNKSGAPFKVFTPYWKHCLTLQQPQPVLVDWENAHFAPAASTDTSADISALRLLSPLGWDKHFYTELTPTRTGALQRLAHMHEQSASYYKNTRDFPDKDATSRLSPYLACGQISPREILHALSQGATPPDAPITFNKPDETLLNGRTFGFLRQLYWREFSYHLLYHFPATPEQALNDSFQLFPWQDNPEALSLWKKGLTGYPIVDAAMRQLWQTGWMHNRLRMIAASLLVKHLLIPWQAGAEWFWDTLTDADLANNTMGWQWTAGCGADAAPYFRIFNPIIQAKKFDPKGHFIRRYCPELAELPDKYIHFPADAPSEILAAAGVVLGKTYPQPIVEHALGRQRALDAFAQFKEARE